MSNILVEDDDNDFKLVLGNVKVDLMANESTVGIKDIVRCLDNIAVKNYYDLRDILRMWVDSYDSYLEKRYITKCDLRKKDEVYGLDRELLNNIVRRLQSPRSILVLRMVLNKISLNLLNEDFSMNISEIISVMQNLPKCTVADKEQHNFKLVLSILRKHKGGGNSDGYSNV